MSYLRCFLFGVALLLRPQRKSRETEGWFAARYSGRRVKGRNLWTGYCGRRARRESPDQGGALCRSGFADAAERQKAFCGKNREFGGMGQNGRAHAAYFS